MDVNDTQDFLQPPADMMPLPGIEGDVDLAPATSEAPAKKARRTPLTRRVKPAGRARQRREGQLISIAAAANRLGVSKSFIRLRTHHYRDIPGAVPVVGERGGTIWMMPVTSLKDIPAKRSAGRPPATKLAKTPVHQARKAAARAAKPGRAVLTGPEQTYNRLTRAVSEFHAALVAFGKDHKLAR